MATLSERVDALERTNVAYDLLLKTLHQRDTDTAHALEQLSAVIQHPRTGLVVTLDRYLERAHADRRTQLAFLGGLIVLINVVVPFIPALFRAIFP